KLPRRGWRADVRLGRIKGTAQFEGRQRIVNDILRQPVNYPLANAVCIANAGLADPDHILELLLGHVVEHNAGVAIIESLPHTEGPARCAGLNPRASAELPAFKRLSDDGRTAIEKAPASSDRQFVNPVEL